MNLNPKFEQYKKDQASLEKIPTIKPDFHVVIENLSSKVINNQELTQQEINDLEMVYNMTQSIEKEIVVFLDHYRSKNVISKTEFLILMGYFLATNQNGPDSTKTKNELIGGMISNEDFEKLPEVIAIPPKTRLILLEVYKKIKQKKPS